MVVCGASLRAGGFLAIGSLVVVLSVTLSHSSRLDAAHRHSVGFAAVMSVDLCVSLTKVRKT